MPKSVIFDLDGTLWDSTSQLVKAWNIVLSNYPNIEQHITIDKMKSIMGMTNEEIISNIFDKYSYEIAHDILRQCQMEEIKYLSIHGAKTFPFLEETLKKLLPHYSLFIVSNCQKGYIEAFLKYYKFDNLFTDFLSSGDTNLPKWKNIKLIMNRNKIKDAIYVGDTKSDYYSALLADIPFIYASYGFGNVQDYTYKIDNLYDLLRLLPNIL